MKKKIKYNYILNDLIKVIKYNVKDIVLFEMMFKSLSIIVFYPLFTGMFNLTMKITGYKYLSLENVLEFLINPVTIIMLLIIILMMSFYTLFDMTCLIILIDASVTNNDITIYDVIKIALKKTGRLLFRGNFLITFYVLFLIPFLNIGISSNFINSLEIPEFIEDYIYSNFLYTVLYLVLFAIFIFLLFRWIYAIHYCVIENEPFIKALKKSRDLGKGNHILDFLKIILTQLIIGIIYILSIGIGVLVIYLLNKYTSSWGMLASILISVVWLSLGISFIIYIIFSTPISYIVISSLYYEHKKDNNETIKHIKVNRAKTFFTSSKWKIVKYSLIIIFIVSASIYTNGILNGDYNLNIEHFNDIEITGHRGASRDYPENTIIAFQKAKDLGADWVELDVQQTKDKQLIISHDSNLKRVTGLNKNIYEVTYDEIKDLDAGSFKDPSFSSARIPLLEDVIKWALLNNMKLNIELKPTGHEEEFEESVVDLINEYNFSKRCVITSQIYEVLENVKSYDQDIKTVYVMSLAYGNILNLDKADYFSVEANSVNKNMVKQIHNEGKKIYAWTVNNEKNIRNMIDLDVDNVITDDITTAKGLVIESKQTNLIFDFVKTVFKLIE